MPLLLSIDSSNGYSSVSIAADGSGVIAESVSGLHEKHSVSIFKQMDEMAGMAGIDLKSLTGIVAILGPGSYTGIRVSLTIAKTLSLALGISILGVGSLFVCAYYLMEKNAGSFERVISAKGGIKNGYYVS